MDLFNWTQKVIINNPNLKLAEDIKRAKIFSFDGADFIDKGIRHSFKKDDFFLPYPVTAVVVSNSDMLMLGDTVPDQIGFSEKRSMLIVDQFMNDEDTEYLKKGEHVLTVFSGSMTDKFDDKDPDALNIGFSNIGFFTKKGCERLISENEIEEKAKEDGPFRNMVEQTTNRFTFHMAALWAINQPENFILEKTPVSPKVKRKTKHNRPRLRHERPEYTILHPDKIRERMHLPPISNKPGAKKRPHERRAHTVFLSDDKYRFGKNGEVLELKVIPYGPRKGELYYKKYIQPAIWIGPKENIVGNHRYRVILDR